MHGMRFFVLMFKSMLRDWAVVRFVRMAAPRQDDDSTVEKIKFERYVFS
jgi:hypothetical protein